jgi:hypothetical protein
MSIQNLFDLCTENEIEIGMSNTFTYVHARISRPNLIEVISDVMYEGSGLLNIYYESHTTGEKINEFLESLGRYYIKDSDFVSIVVDENDMESLKVFDVSDSDDKCEDGCKCINCHALIAETTCASHCKCINCSS